jgi:heme O synthase-like polyprenyltransferase
MTTPDVDVPLTGRSQRWRIVAREFLELTKPRVVALIVFTALVGMFLAVPGLPPPDKLLFGMLGIALAAGSAAAINHLLDQKADALMARTRRRPLPTGQPRRRRPPVLGWPSMLVGQGGQPRRRSDPPVADRLCGDLRSALPPHRRTS